MERLIDVFTTVSPDQIKAALESDEVGYNPGEMKFYQIDPALYPDLSNPEKTAICLFEYDTEGNQTGEKHIPFNHEELNKHTLITDKVIQGYTHKVKEGDKPLLFLGIPHVMHKGSIDISNCPVITV